MCASRLFKKSLPVFLGGLVLVFFSLSRAMGQEPVPSQAAEQADPQKATGQAEPNPADSKAPASKANEAPKEDPKAAPKADAKTVKKFITVKEEFYEEIIEIPGTVESRTNMALQIDPQVWSDFLVEVVVDHGKRVEKGDILIRFDTEKLEKAIEDEISALPLAKLRLETARVDLSVKEQVHPLDLERKRSSYADSLDDFKYFEEVRHSMDERNARESLKSSQNYLAYAEEELKQLKKMYENDQVTEETEEIILRRAQDSIDRERWNVTQAEVRTKRTLDTTIPREGENRKRDMRIKELEWKVAEANSRRELEIKRLEVAEEERNLAKAEEKLAKLRLDLGNMSLRAPSNGIIYYGANLRGKWTTASTIEKKLIPGGRVTPNEIIMTLTDPADLRIRLDVPEDKLKHIKQKQKVSVVMKWNEDLALDGTVDTISYVPQTSSTFDAVVTCEIGSGDQAIFPGMNSTIKITAFKSDKAITLPRKAVTKEGDKSFVTLKNGEKRLVEVAYSSKDKIVIKSGLQAGEEIEEGESNPTS